MHLPDYDYMYILDMLKYMCFCTDFVNSASLSNTLK